MTCSSCFHKYPFPSFNKEGSSFSREGNHNDRWILRKNAEDLKKLGNITLDLMNKRAYDAVLTRDYLRG
jgi:hypothetical protein